MSSIPDIDVRRVTIRDIEREILANEMKTNQKEGELLALQLAADTLHEYLRKFVRFSKRPTTSLKKLERVQQFVKDVESIFKDTAYFDVSLTLQNSKGDTTMKSVCDAFDQIEAFMGEDVDQGPMSEVTSDPKSV